MNVCEGGWVLEPEENETTRAIYSIFADDGGALPPFLANNGRRSSAGKLDLQAAARRKRGIVGEMDWELLLPALPCNFPGGQSPWFKA